MQALDAIGEPVRPATSGFTAIISVTTTLVWSGVILVAFLLVPVLALGLAWVTFVVMRDNKKKKGGGGGAAKQPADDSAGFGAGD